MTERNMNPLRQTHSRSGKKFNIYIEDIVAFINTVPDERKIGFLLEYVARTCCIVNEKNFGEQSIDPKNYKTRQADEDINVMFMALLEGQKLVDGTKIMEPEKICVTISREIFNKTFETLPSLRQMILKEMAYVGLSNGILWAQYVEKETRSKNERDVIGGKYRERLQKNGWSTKSIDKINEIMKDIYYEKDGQYIDVMSLGSHAYNLSVIEGTKSKRVSHIRQKDGAKHLLPSKKSISIERFNSNRHGKQNLSVTSKKETQKILRALGVYFIYKHEETKIQPESAKLVQTRPTLKKMSLLIDGIAEQDIDIFIDKAIEISRTKNDVKHHLKLINVFSEFKNSILDTQRKKTPLYSGNSLIHIQESGKTLLFGQPIFL